MAVLKTDDIGNPIPQHYNPNIGDFESTHGTENAMYTKDISRPKDGIYPVKLTTPEGTNLPVTSMGIPVVLSANDMDNFVYNGIEWVEFTPSYTANIIAENAYINSSSSGVINNTGCKTCLLCIRGSNLKIASIDIKLEFADGSVVYKNIAKSITGNDTIVFGLGTENDFAVPARFSVTVNHTDSTSMTYKVDIQLV